MGAEWSESEFHHARIFPAEQNLRLLFNPDGTTTPALRRYSVTRQWQDLAMRTNFPER